MQQAQSVLMGPWQSRLMTLTLHSFKQGVLRLYYMPRPDAPVMTDSFEVEPLLRALPDLRRHRCDNGQHHSFAQQARQTELAHLLEHLLIELLAQTGVARSCIEGATNVDAAPLCYRIRISGWSDCAQVEETVTKALRILDGLKQRL